MKLDKLYYFESAARHESFTAAAKEFHIAPSAISQQIKLLEKSIGFSLFNRHSNKKLSLTPSGKVFYKRVKDILYLYKNAVDEARLESNCKNNVLTIGLCEKSSIYILNDVIHKFKEKHPSIEIKLNQINNDDCSLELFNNNCDIVFSCKNFISKSNYNLDYKIIHYSDFGVFIDSSSHLASKEYVSFNDLITSQLHIYVLDIYKDCLIKHSPELINSIKTEPSMNLLFASGYLNKGIILTSYEESKILNQNHMIFKRLKDCPINTIHELYYLKNNSNWALKEFLMMFV